MRIHQLGIEYMLAAVMIKTTIVLQASFNIVGSKALRSLRRVAESPAVLCQRFTLLMPPSGRNCNQPTVWHSPSKQRREVMSTGLAETRLSQLGNAPGHFSRSSSLLLLLPFPCGPNCSGFRLPRSHCEL